MNEPIEPNTFVPVIFVPVIFVPVIFEKKRLLPCKLSTFFIEENPISTSLIAGYLAQCETFEIEPGVAMSSPFRNKPPEVAVKPCESSVITSVTIFIFLI